MKTIASWISATAFVSLATLIVAASGVMAQDEDIMSSGMVPDPNVVVPQALETTGNPRIVYGCSEVAYVLATSCPAGDTDGATCDNVPAGSFCEGDGECGTDINANNCGGYDWYFRPEW